MLKAIWPSLRARVPNHLPESANITTLGRAFGARPFQSSLYNIGIMCYFIYWAIQFPFMLVSPQKIKWLFLAKALIVPPSWLALLIWALVKVPPSKGLFTLHPTVTGSDFSWAYLMGLNASLGSFATLAVNIPDFTVTCFQKFRSRSVDADWCLLLAICEN